MSLRSRRTADPLGHAGAPAHLTGERPIRSLRAVKKRSIDFDQDRRAAVRAGLI
jgi:hypothetical protein